VIRITTDRAIDAALARHRMAVADQIAEAVEAMPVLRCAHRGGADLPSCPRCVQRRAVAAAADVVRKTGGVQ